jgi:hypothetical protein
MLSVVKAGETESRAQPWRRSCDVSGTMATPREVQQRHLGKGT